MFSEEYIEEYLSSGKDEFTVGQLDATLKECYALVHPDVDKALANESHDAVASAADWEKFYDIINKVDAPVTALVQVPDSEQRGDTISKRTDKVLAATTAVSMALGSAHILWRMFSGWDDKAGRSKWTVNLVCDAIHANPQFNYVVVCTNHSTNFNGVRNKDWSGCTYDYRLKIGQIRYTLYAFRSGIFTLLGDEGHFNWAYYGSVVSDSHGSPRRVVFR